MNDKKIKEILDGMKCRPLLQGTSEQNKYQARMAYMDRITAQAFLSYFLTEYFETPIVAQVRVECPTASLYLTQEDELEKFNMLNAERR